MLLDKYILQTNWKFMIYCIQQIESILIYEEDFLLISFVGLLLLLLESSTTYINNQFNYIDVQK
jgi:hypothetical protein